ncbi:class I SAM-dependent methyltransferase [Rhodoflexus caldus]|uniref:class I SAM-dependent methyltransferase n=1 Tax=Rhodoflexus caldus TaxID=2891236 RepID=UPI00202A8D2D|nr:methyltransferase domain-containing protein [Rhodoflexus caldus]
MQKLDYVNLGCGSHFDVRWINIDFISSNNYVISHNLINGIPLSDNSVSVVYHSHVLEHFSKAQAIDFINECYRVLKHGGIIRIATPDLERIIQDYQNTIYYLEKNPDDVIAQANHEWIMIEMYDQCVRHSSGGEMVNFLSQDDVCNLDYVYSRIGYEGECLRENLLKNKKNSHLQEEIKNKDFFTKIIWIIQNPLIYLKEKIKYILFKDEIMHFKQMEIFTKIGQFRLGGEVHQWMYDRFSLSRLLTNAGFSNIRIVNAFESSIPNWQEFNLDIKNNKTRKPDSIFIEAQKL